MRHEFRARDKSRTRHKLNEYKRRAAECAVEFVESGMVVGLGHGTTAGFAVVLIGELLRVGRLNDIIGIPCSNEMEAEAVRAGIPTGTLETHPEIDLTIDGADEVDPRLDMIKGGGGALLREKVVAEASRRRIYIVDETKLSPCIGTLHSVPVEVTPFAWKPVSAYLTSLKATSVVRREKNGRPFLTDQGNFILDCNFGRLGKPEKLAAGLKGRAGIIEHGLFLGLATDVIVSGPAGTKHMTR
ncbi:MAG TPA: ribose 5-phosphate isomerase A [Bacteroidota bacterium]|nr:ribose 5-phosphate isomerase A [Bacteroidota bacterium]